MSILSWLPTELIVNILSDHVLDFRDRASISLTCRLFHNINEPILYAQNIQNDSSSCLFWAAKHGRIGTLKHALAAGANVNTEGWLSDKDDDIDMADSDDTRVTTPLHIAAKHGQRDVAEWLIDHGADVDAASYKFCDALVVYWRQYFTPVWRPGWTPLFAALNHEQASTAELLVSRRAEVTNMHTRRRRIFIPALHVAAANGMSSVISLLAKSGDFDVNSRDFGGNTALHYCTQYWPDEHNDLKCASSPIPLLLGLGADIEAVNNRLQNPLIHACWMGNFRAATILVKAGANPKAECYVREIQKLVRPLYLASLSRADVARQSGSEPYQDASAWEGARAEFFQALIAAGVDVNSRLTYSRSFDIPMLQRVCLDNNYSAAKTLIEVAGADVNATDGQGQTALLGYLREASLWPTCTANSHGMGDIFSLLLASRARLDIPDENGRDALQQAIEWALAGTDSSSCLQTLLRLANASSISRERVEAAISFCCSQPVPSAHVVDLLHDFQSGTRRHGVMAISNVS